MSPQSLAGCVFSWHPAAVRTPRCTCRDFSFEPVHIACSQPQMPPRSLVWPVPAAVDSVSRIPGKERYRCCNPGSYQVPQDAASGSSLRYRDSTNSVVSRRLCNSSEQETQTPRCNLTCSESALFNSLSKNAVKSSEHCLQYNHTFR